MDTTTISTLTGVVLGAVTTSIPKLWDLLFENKKHWQTNQKLVFERKVTVLQAYVSVCTQLSAANFHSAISVEQVMKMSFFGEQNPMAALVMENLDKNANKNQEAANELTALSSAVSMFIDLKIDEDAAYSLIKSIHDDIAKLGVLSEEVRQVIDKYNLDAEPPKNTPQGKEYSETKEKFNNHLQGISDKYNQVKQNMNDCIKVVRNEFSKYND